MKQRNARQRMHRTGSRPAVGTRVVALLGVLALVLAACGGDDAADDDVGDDPQTENGDEGTANGGDGAEVTVWLNDVSVPDDDFGQLQEEHGITVSWDARGDEILTDLLRMRDAGQDLPDLIEIDSALVPAFLEADLLEPMTEFVDRWQEEDPDLYDTVVPEVWEDGVYDGEIYHVPNKSLVNALYYNIHLLEEAGVEPEFDTWWDVVDAARAVQEVQPDLPAYFGTGGTSPDRIFNWLYNFGVPFDDNIPDLTSAQGVDMIDFLQTMYEEGITDPEYVIGQQDESLGAFVQGNLPFISEGLNGGPGFMLDDFVYGEDWATVGHPVDEANGGTEMGAPRGLSIVAGSPVAYEASLAMRYLMSPEIAEVRYLELETGIPESIPVLEGERLAEEQPFFTDELLETFRSMESQIPPGTNTNAVGEVLNDMLEEVSVVGTDDSPEEIAERYQEQLDGLG